MSRRLRVLHCPTTTGGHPGALAKAERDLGLDSTCVALRAPFDHSADEILYRAGDGILRRQARRWGLVLRALRGFDIVHFNFGSTCLPHALPLDDGAGLAERLFHLYCRIVERRELHLLRAAGVEMVVTFQGSDARQSAFFHRHLEADEREGLEAYLGPKRDRAKRRLIDEFSRRVGHTFFLNPDLATVLPTERVSFLPYAVPEPDEVATTSRPRFTIAHAPSHRAVKGTDAIVEAVRALGDGVDLDLIEGVSHSEALDRLARADLVVEQVIVGWYGATAVEAMAMGRPVVATILDDYLDVVPAALLADLPIIRAPRRELADILRWCIANRDELRARGRAGPMFASTWHDPLQVARQTHAVYERLCR